MSDAMTGRLRKDRAILAARVILRASNIDPDSDVALIARELLRALNLPERQPR